MLDHIFLDVKSVRGSRVELYSKSIGTGFQQYEPKPFERSKSPSIYNSKERDYSIYIPNKNEYFEKLNQFRKKRALMGFYPDIERSEMCFDISYDHDKRAILITKGTTHRCEYHDAQSFGGEQLRIRCGESFFPKIAHFKLRRGKSVTLEYKWSYEFQGLIMYLEKQIL